MKSKTAVLTAAAGRKLLNRIRTLEDEIHAVEQRCVALEAVFSNVLAGKIRLVD